MYGGNNVGRYQCRVEMIQIQHEKKLIFEEKNEVIFSKYFAVGVNIGY